MLQFWYIKMQLSVTGNNKMLTIAYNITAAIILTNVSFLNCKNALYYM